MVINMLIGYQEKPKFKHGLGGKKYNEYDRN